MKQKIIYDLGANNGDNIPYYLKKCNRVVAVEANPSLCKEIKIRFRKEILKKRLFVENFVLTDDNNQKEATFYLSKTQTVLSQLPKPDNLDEYSALLLPATTIIKLIKKHGAPYYIKIDLEHYDNVILKDLFKNNIRSKYISAEFHNKEIFSTLVDFGNYNAFKLVEGDTIPDLYRELKIDKIENKETYSFPHHSGGPFGDDIDGNWMTTKNFSELLSFTGMGWRDIHASSVAIANPKHRADLKNYIMENGVLKTKRNKTKAKKSKSYIAIVTAVEPNNHHGVGVFLEALIKKLGKCIVFRGASIYNKITERNARHYQINESGLLDIKTKLNIFGKKISKILVIPYFKNTVLFAQNLQKYTGAPLYTYIMDDLTIFEKQVDSASLKELLEKSKKIFSVSNELTSTYKKQFKIPIETLLPTLPYCSQPKMNTWENLSNPFTVPMIGNIWSQERLDQLLQVFKNLPWQVLWFGNGGKAPWLKIDEKKWEKHNLLYQGWAEEEFLTNRLSEAPFVLVPSGDMDISDKSFALSKLSLPSRILFTHMRVDTPILLVGDKKTAAGRFILKNGTGLCGRCNTQIISKLGKSLLDKEKRYAIISNIQKTRTTLLKINAQDEIAKILS